MQWRPVGRLPARTYWVRRAVLAGVLIIVIAVIVYACSGGSTPRPTADRGPRPSPTPSVSPSPGVAVRACAAADVTVRVSTDASVYPAGVEPHFTLSVSTITRCRLNFSASVRRFTVVSGSDRIWSSADCQSTTPAKRVVVRPGHPRRAAVIWARVRSRAGCPSGVPTAQPGTYRVSAAVGDVRSSEEVFTLR